MSHFVIMYNDKLGFHPKEEEFSILMPQRIPILFDNYEEALAWSKLGNLLKDNSFIERACHLHDLIGDHVRRINGERDKTIRCPAYQDLKADVEIEMHFIVPSIGRCASTLIANLIMQAIGKPVCYVWDIKTEYGPFVSKTHQHFLGEPAYPYRAVYVWGHIGDIIASMYHWDITRNFESHFAHLEVEPEHRSYFFEMIRRGLREDGWLYLVDDDKLRFKNNLASWEQARHVLFIRYEDLCADAPTTMAHINHFTGLTLDVPRIVPRKGRFGHLSGGLQQAIQHEYGELLE
jgi:hypothetical protein